jgi:hypothetical protein
MKLLNRLRLLAHVLANGCRIVDITKLECSGCKYEPNCHQGYYAPEKGTAAGLPKATF